MSETKTKSSRSPIWHYFEPVDVKNTKCLLCESTYRNSGNTTNLIDHLKRKHRQEYTQVAEMMKSQTNNNSNDSEIPIAIDAINEKQESTSEIIEEQEQPMVNSGEDKNQEFEEPENAQIVKIVPLPHARSEVWTYFGFVANDEGQILDRSKVVCKICASTFCYSGNTTNFYSHLKSMHSEVQMRAVSIKSNRSMKRTYSNIVEDGSDLEVVSGTTNENSGTYQHQNNNSTIPLDEEPLPDRSLDSIIYVDDITQCLIDFLVTDCRPLCVVQGKGFQRFLRLLAPGYVLPDKQKLSNALRRRYDELRKSEREPSAVDRFNNLI